MYTEYFVFACHTNLKKMKILVYGYLRIEFEIKYKTVIIPNGIKLLLSKFTGNLLTDSKILTNNEKTFYIIY